MMLFLMRTTPRVRSVFVFPEPGNPYYTEKTLSLGLNKSVGVRPSAPCAWLVPYGDGGTMAPCALSSVRIPSNGTSPGVSPVSAASAASAPAP